MGQLSISANFSGSRLSHAYLILMRNYEKRLSTLQEIVQNLKISTADQILLEKYPDKKNILISQVHELQRLLYLKPHSSPYKLAVILEGELLTVVAQGALLKILEEPPARSIMIIFAENKSSLLETVVSRCRILEDRQVIPSDYQYLLPQNFPDLKEKIDLAEKLARSEDLPEILDQWLWQLRQKLLGGEKVEEQIETLLWARSILNTNVNRRLLLENVLMEF